MTIGYVLGEFPALSETFILREILALREAGIRVVVFALHRSASRKVHPLAIPLLAEARFRPALGARQMLRAHAHFARRAPRRYARMVMRMALRISVWPPAILTAMRNLPAAAAFSADAEALGVQHIHAHFAFTPADVAEAMALLTGKPFSVSVHAKDVYTQSRRVLRMRLSGARFVAACTNHGLAHIRAKVSEIGARTTLVRHGLRVPQIEPGRRKTDLLLAVGRLEEKKGFIHLIDACRLLSESRRSYQCLLVGDGSQRRCLEQRIMRDGLSGRVVIRGEADQDELAALYREATVLVAPSIVAGNGDHDGLPNVILEALAMRIPVVSTPVGGIPELIEDGVNGLLVPPGDARSLAAALARLLEDGELRERMGKAGRTAVEHRFDISKNISDLIHLFRRSTASLT